jgi:hypothetical protein
MPGEFRITLEIRLGAQNLAKLFHDASVQPKNFCDALHDLATSLTMQPASDALAREKKAFHARSVRVRENFRRCRRRRVRSPERKKSTRKVEFAQTLRKWAESRTVSAD